MEEIVQPSGRSFGTGCGGSSLKTRWIENVAIKSSRAWLSYTGCMVDALASKADEGRGIAAKSFGEPLTRL